MEFENSLLSQLASKESLQNAWNLLNKENVDSRGLSGVTIDDFSKDLDSNLSMIGKELISETFHFSPTRAAIIKKENGKYRPLQIPEIRDRIVLKAMAILLEENLKDILSKSEGISFAYQHGKGVRDAVLKMKLSYQLEGKVILKADIINFFEEVQKDKLLNDLVYPNLSDTSINKLIDNSLKQKLLGLNRLRKEHRQLFKNAGKGIPQGNPLSPLLSNIYLSTFDSYLKENNYSMVRYADDFIVVFKSEDEAKGGYKVINSYLLDKFSLNIHPLESDGGKTVIINPAEKDFAFLSIKFDGMHIYPGNETLSVLKSRIKKAIKKAELSIDLFKEINEIVEKWIAIYSYSDIERYFDDIDRFVIFQLEKRFGKRSYKTSKCYVLAQKVRIKQYNKNKRSFWRDPKLTDLLPGFLKRKESNK